MSDDPRYLGVLGRIAKALEQANDLHAKSIALQEAAGAEDGKHRRSQREFQELVASQQAALVERQATLVEQGERDTVARERVARAVAPTDGDAASRGKPS